MKIYVLGSNTFMKKMVDVKNRLYALGFHGWIHPDYDLLVQGKRQDIARKLSKGENATVKIENNYFREHYKHILESDAILVVNEQKNGFLNYIGGNVLMEMGQAYVNNKKIFLLNNMPSGLPYDDEIKAMTPICLNGNLKKINES